MNSKIIGCGGYLPTKILKNHELESFLDTSDEWIKSRTGISQRHIAEKDELASHMALEAASGAINDAGLENSEIDIVIVCTTTPDNSFPSTATKLQALLNLGNVPAFDFQTVCSGFIYGLQIADGLISSGKYKTILLVCAEKMSSLVDWQDRSTCILFGDGAGAIILQATSTNSGLIDSKIYANGSYYDILHTNGGIGMTGSSGTIQMKGQTLFKHAVEKMSSSITEIIKANHVSLDEVKYLIPHQANSRIIDSVAQQLNFDKNKVVKTINKHANCSAASIPLALWELKKMQALKENDLILLTAIGAGLTWGSALIHW